MTCDDTRSHLLDFVRRRLEPELTAEVGAHLDGCEACGGEERSERALDELLETRLPRHAAPTSLKRRLGLLMGRPARPEPRRWVRLLAPALAAGLALALAGVLLQHRLNPGGELATLASEVVNDHLRVLASQHPLDVESGGMHQVKPWFEGKLDFAPTVPAPDVSDLRLRGGSVGYVFDRKAAVLSYALRLHAVTLLAFRPEGLAWPAEGAELQLGPVRGHETSTRGFHVVLWQAGGLAYALVSDVNPSELRELAERFAPATVQPRAP